MCQVGVRVEPCQVVRAVSLTTAPIPRLARRGCCPCKWPSCSRQGRTTSLYNSRCFDNPPLAEALRQPFFDAPRAPCRVLLVGAAVMLRRLCRRPHWLLLLLVVVVVVVVLLLLLLLLPLAPISDDLGVNASSTSRRTGKSCVERVWESNQCRNAPVTSCTFAIYTFVAASVSSCVLCHKTMPSLGTSYLHWCKPFPLAARSQLVAVRARKDAPQIAQAVRRMLFVGSFSWLPITLPVGSPYFLPASRMTGWVITLSCLVRTVNILLSRGGSCCF